MVFAFGISAMTLACPAAAQQPPQDDCVADAATCGKKEFEKGVAAYQQGDFGSAMLHFKQALAYRPHPVVAFNLALAEGKSGLLVEAVARLEQVLADPQSSAKLKTNATRERDGFAAGIGAILLESALASGVQATVDGAPLTGSPPAIQVNPGKHQVLVRVDGRAIVDRSISVNPGERVRLAISREREVSVVVPPPARQPDNKPPVQPTPKKGIDPVWFYGSAGVTLVLGGVTTWSALDTKSAYDDYKAALPTLTQDEIDRQVSDGHAKETRTNVLLGATALAALGSAALGVFAVNWGSSDTASAVAVTPGGVMVRGSF
jgi:tetratricopeptide (TPR) repeat protein